MAQVAYGVFNDTAGAEQSITRLRGEGFHPEFLSIHMMDREKEQDLALKYGVKSHTVEANQIPKDFVLASGIGLILFGILEGLLIGVFIHYSTPLTHPVGATNISPSLPFTIGFGLWNGFAIMGLAALLILPHYYRSHADALQYLIHGDQVAMAVRTRTRSGFSDALRILEEQGARVVHPGRDQVRALAIQGQTPPQTSEKKRVYVRDLVSPGTVTDMEVAADTGFAVHYAGEEATANLYTCTNCGQGYLLKKQGILPMCSCGNSIFAVRGRD